MNALKYSLLCVLNLQQLKFNQVEAISREISYPLGSILGLQNYPMDVSSFQDIPVTNKLSEFDETYIDIPKQKYRNKLKIARAKKKHYNDEQTGEKGRKRTGKRKATRKKMKKNKSRMKFVKTSLNGDEKSDIDSTEIGTRKERAPVDIVVHIKMANT